MDDVMKYEQYPVCVIATSIADGKRFAENLKLDNYVVYTAMMVEKMEGRRFREVVVTFEYLNNIMEVTSRSMHPLFIGGRSKVY